MTPFRKWLVRAAEKVAGIHYEGPSAPDRLIDIVEDFSNHNPRATRAEWAAFAVAHAAECYRAGYMRGVEYTERAPETWRPDVDPEVIADGLDPEWRKSAPISLDDPGGIILDELDITQTIDEQIRQVNG
jgi:hypothetical protein